MINEPKLEPPGAGLSLPQRILIRSVFGPLVSNLTPLRQCQDRYDGVTDKLIQLIRPLSNDERSVRVLIDPIKGLEDSSRYWSINGVLEHLLIVSGGMDWVVRSLSRGDVPDQTVDISKYKPKSQGDDPLPRFLEVAPGLARSLADDLSFSVIEKSKKKFRHPWFGDLSARQWFWLLSFHQTIHYKQAKAIRTGLARPRAHGL